MVDLSSILVPLINQSQLFGIYVILALGLNLEYGFTGVPNFGKVFFYGLGAFLTGGIVAHLIGWLATRSLVICTGTASVTRDNFALGSPAVVAGIFLLAIVLSALITGMFGYIMSYPALRLREDYLGILLIASGEISRVFVRSMPSNWIACRTDTLTSIPSPFYWLIKYVPASGNLPSPYSWVTAGILSGAPFAILILAMAFVCYLIVSKLSNSPYGRMLKSVRDDEQAAVGLGKDPAKARAQVMIIGSMMAGVAGSLFIFVIGAVNNEDFVPLLTFIVWSIVLVGGSANNRGVLLGAVTINALIFLTPLVGNWVSTTLPQFSFFTKSSVDLTNYAEQAVLGTIIILVILFRPQGILREKPLKTPAWKVLKNTSDPNDKQSN